MQITHIKPLKVRLQAGRFLQDASPYIGKANRVSKKCPNLVYVASNWLILAEIKKLYRPSTKLILLMIAVSYETLSYRNAIEALSQN